VLGAVVDESLPLAACSEVVYDALAVVGMKEMKVSRVPTLVAATCLPQLLTLLLTARLTVFFSLSWLVTTHELRLGPKRTPR
jgi:hypothetical protein